MKKILILLIISLFPLVTFADKWPWINCYWLPGCNIQKQWLNDYQTDYETKKEVSFSWWVVYLTNVISDGIKYTAVFSVLAIIMSGIYFVSSAWNEDKAKRAKKLVTWSIIWVLISTSAWSMVSILNKFKFGDTASEQKAEKIDTSVDNDWTTPEVNITSVTSNTNKNPIKLTQAKAIDKYTILVTFDTNIAEDDNISPYQFKLEDLNWNKIELELSLNELYKEKNMRLTTKTQLKNWTEYKIIASWVKWTSGETINSGENDTIYFTTSSTLN